MKKRLHILFMALLAMAVLGGCGADGTGESSEDTSSKEQNVQETEISEGPVYGGSVVVGIQQDIDSLDPHKATAAGTKEILFNVFEGLVKPDENGNLICAVASDYSISDDGLVYTFTLRDGVKFHNGNDVTCEDVKYSLERATSIFEDFRCRTQFTHDGHFFLRNTFHCTGKNGIYGFYHQATAQQHQFVVDDTHVVRIGNGYPYLLDNLTGVNLMFQEESGDARFRITINHRPVDGGCAAILRKQGSIAACAVRETDW